MGYAFVATDRAGVPLGELLQANPRSLRFAIGNIDSFTWEIDVDHPLATALSDTGRTLIKVYDDVIPNTKTLRLHGPVATREKNRNTTGGRIALTAASPMWRLARRLVGKSIAGLSIGTALATVDRGTMLTQVLTELNTAGDTGLRMGTVTASSKTYGGPWRYKKASEVVTELTATLDGPDWRVRPIEATPDGYGLALGLLDVAPFIGTVQPNCVWEFGTGRRNVADWRDVGDAGALANDIYELPGGFPDTAGSSAVLRSTSSSSITDYGLNEEAMSSGIESDALRQRLIDEHVAIRRVPRRVITFTPIAESDDVPLEERRLPRLFVDYSPGDVVIFRAVERFSVRDVDGTVLGYREVRTVNAYFRIYAVTLNFNDAGVATPTVTLVADENTANL